MAPAAIRFHPAAAQEAESPARPSAPTTARLAIARFDFDKALDAWRTHPEHAVRDYGVVARRDAKP